MSLRKKVIRLAHAKPELREHLLPLIKTGARGWRSDLVDPSLAKKGVAPMAEAFNIVFDNYGEDEEIEDRLDEFSIFWTGITDPLKEGNRPVLVEILKDKIAKYLKGEAQKVLQGRPESRQFVGLAVKAGNGLLDAILAR